MKTPWPLLLLLPFLAGCRAPVLPEVYLAPGLRFRLRPAAEGPPMFVTQEVVFRLPGGAEETAIAVLENRASAFSLVASSPLGQTLFVVRLEGARVRVEARVPIPGDLDPRVLPALVQFALWPAEAVRRGLGPDATLVEDGPRRSLLRKGKPIWTAIREGDRLRLENPGMQLTVRIRTLEAEP